MTEPRRWLQDPQTSAELRQVLEASSPSPPLPAELHAQLSELAVGLASQSLLAQVGGTSLWQKLLLALGGSGKALGIAALVGAAGVGTYAVTRERSPTGVSTTRAPLRPAAPGVAPSVAFAPQPLAASSAAAQQLEPRGAVIPARQAPSVPLSAPPEIASTAPSSTAASGDESIAQEAKMLESARSFLADSPALALQLTEQHQRLHPTAQLSAERELIAIEALLRLGRRQEAERRAASWLEQAPGGLYARRLRQLLTPAAPKK